MINGTIEQLTAIECADLIVWAGAEDAVCTGCVDAITTGAAFLARRATSIGIVHGTFTGRGGYAASIQTTQACIAPAIEKPIGAGRLIGNAKIADTQLAIRATDGSTLTTNAVVGAKAVRTRRVAIVVATTAARNDVETNTVGAALTCCAVTPGCLAGASSAGADSGIGVCAQTQAFDTRMTQGTIAIGLGR